MTLTPAEIGQLGEQYAADYLSAERYEIIERNWRWRGGELDLVAREGEELVMVEVKARRTRSYGYPEEAVTPAKQSKLVQAAKAYLEGKDWLDRDWRIDVIAIDLASDGSLVNLDHFENPIGE